MFRVKVKKRNEVQSYFKYLLNGITHREDGPAIEWADGSKIWFKNGLRHRDDGPAIEGGWFSVWYKNGIEDKSSIRVHRV